jgi:RIO-like serine/threonine protein kinase
MPENNLEGHSGSKLEKRGRFIEKRSTYLANCENPENRGRFLIELSKKFSHMPKIIEVRGDLIVYEYVDGEPGFERANLRSFGKIVCELHELKMEIVPEIDTGVHWLHELADNNLRAEGIVLGLNTIVAELSADKKVIVHCEITDVVVNKAGKITIVDWDEAGLGTKYQDLGMIYFHCFEKRDGEKDWDEFLEGYDDASLNRERVLSAAGLIAIAYSRWGNKDFRLKFGRSLLRNN